MKSLPKKKKKRFGVKRLMVHIIICFVLAALFCSIGFFGKNKLSMHAESFKTSSRVDTLHKEGIAEVEKLFLEAAGEENAAIIKRSVSSRKRMLKKDISAMIDEGADNAAVLAHIADTLLEETAKNLDENAALLVRNEAESKLPYIFSQVDRIAQEHVDSLSISSVRKRLSVNTPLYPLMYYSSTLVWTGAVFLAFALLLSFLWIKNNDEGKAKISSLLEPLDYLLPFFLGVIVFTLYPMIRVVIMSFQERYKLDGSFIGWGLGNYEYVLKGIPGTSNYFLQGLINTFLYVLYTVPATTAISVIIAFLLNKKLKGSALYQTAYFLPMVTSITAVGLVWRWIFNKNFGVLNALLMFFSAEPLNWLQATENSMAVMVIFGIWNSLPFTIILMLSGLQNIDETYYTVAKVDGAKTPRIFRRITLPLLAPTIGLVLVINSISAFKVFTEVTVLFNGSPGPAYNMYTVVYYIYEMMHQRLELGRAAAAAIVLFFFILIFTMVQRYIQRRWNYI
ncbi:MAG: carbohydrate ABC transporter permease [Christensenellales bacterium]|jgi:multiple sugar transport system permease protein